MQSDKMKLIEYLEAVVTQQRHFVEDASKRIATQQGLIDYLNSSECSPVVVEALMLSLPVNMGNAANQVAQMRGVRQ